MTNLKLSYRLKRFFKGESGIVEKVEQKTEFRATEYIKDDNGNLPEKIVVRNPLGELVEMNSYLISEGRYEPKKGRVNYLVYKQFKPGDKFP